jgi:hypothetical protein
MKKLRLCLWLISIGTIGSMVYTTNILPASIAGVIWLACFIADVCTTNKLYHVDKSFLKNERNKFFVLFLTQTSSFKKAVLLFALTVELPLFALASLFILLLFAGSLLTTASAVFAVFGYTHLTAAIINNQ